MARLIVFGLVSIIGRLLTTVLAISYLWQTFAVPRGLSPLGYAEIFGFLALIGCLQLGRVSTESSSGNFFSDELMSWLVLMFSVFVGFAASLFV